jgi:hypothetical protein
MVSGWGPYVSARGKTFLKVFQGDGISQGPVLGYQDFIVMVFTS